MSKPIEMSLHSSSPDYNAFEVVIEGVSHK